MATTTEERRQRKTDDLAAARSRRFAYLFEQPVDRGDELLYALALERGDDVVIVDAGGAELVAWSSGSSGVARCMRRCSACCLVCYRWLRSSM